MLEFRLLGPFEASRDGRPIPDTVWRRAKTVELLKLLLSDRGHVFTDDQLVDRLFSTGSLDSGYSNVRGRISELRRALEPSLEKGRDSRYVKRMGEGYCFSSAARVWLDTETFRKLVADARHAHQRADWEQVAHVLEEALALCRGDYLENDRYAEWTFPFREEWLSTRLDVENQLAEAHAEMGNLDKAIARCSGVVALQPAREAAVRQLMTWHYMAGQDALAIDAFERCRSKLKADLDVEPSNETTALYERIRRGEMPREAPSLDPCRVAVLPFANLCPDPVDEYFVDGMTEELIYALARVRGLRVIAQTSVLSYKGTRKRVAQIGRELRVGTVAEGSVRKADGRFRITVQLITVENEEHIWACEYDRCLEDVFAIQTEISQNVVHSLCRHLKTARTQTAALRYAGKPEAYRLFLEGRFFLKKRFGDSLQKARESFERALHIDPGFGLARAGLASSFWLLAQFQLIPFEEGMAQAERYAKDALAQDAQAGDAYAALAAVRSLLFHDLHGAAALHDQGVDADPHNVELRHWRAANLLFLGEAEDAVTAYRDALTIDPLSMLLNRSLGYALMSARRYHEALEQLQLAARLEKHDWSLQWCLGLVYLHMQQYERAREAFALSIAASREVDVKPSLDCILYAHVRSLMGEPDALGEAIDEMSKTEGRDGAVVAVGHFLNGELDAGFEWLDRARDECAASWYLYVLPLPVLDPIRQDPRFQEHISRLGARTT